MKVCNKIQKIITNVIHFTLYYGNYGKSRKRSALRKNASISAGCEFRSLAPARTQAYCFRTLAELQGVFSEAHVLGKNKIVV